jgi:UDP:flavonoid glycosyltransferase YjiC (YdhE family)
VVITILALGSRGDVDPLLAFGSALAQAGHEVRVAAFGKFEPRVSALGLDFAPLAEGQVSKGLGSAAGRRWLERGSKRLPAAVGLIQDARSVARRRLADALAACEGSEAIVASELGVLLGWQMSERFHAPLVRVRLSPPGRFLGGPAGAVLRQAAWLLARPWLGSVRRDAGLPPLPLREPLGELAERRTLELYAYSPAVAPPPGHVGPWTHVTGYWFLEPSLDPDPPAQLHEFLAAGEPPVCFGFGSMLTADPATMNELAVEALAGRRGVLVGDLHVRAGGELPPNVLAVAAVDHGWLFERCAAAVHHGGAGTTAAALRAGVPSVIVPHMLDQFAWGRRLAQLGAGPPPIPRRKLSAPRLREAITAAVGDPRFARTAAALGEQVRQEDGVGCGLEAFQRHLTVADHQFSTITHG